MSAPDIVGLDEPSFVIVDVKGHRATIVKHMSRGQGCAAHPVSTQRGRLTFGEVALTLADGRYVMVWCVVDDVAHVVHAKDIGGEL